MQSFREKSIRPPGTDVLQAAALLHQGRLAEAAAALKLLIAAQPDNHAALHLLGLVALARGNPTRAIAKLRKALALQPRSAIYAGNLANAYLKDKQFAVAAAQFRQVLRLQHDLHIARFGLGMALLGTTDYSGAALELAAFLRTAPDHVDARHSLATALSQLQQIGCEARRIGPVPQRMAGRLTQSALPASPPPFPETSAYAGSAPSFAPSPH